MQTTVIYKSRQENHAGKLNFERQQMQQDHQYDTREF